MHDLFFFHATFFCLTHFSILIFNLVNHYCVHELKLGGVHNVAITCELEQFMNANLILSTTGVLGLW